MRQHRRKGHIRRRGPSSWEIKWDAGIDRTTGKRLTRYRTIQGRKKDAQDALDLEIAAVANGTSVNPAKVTLGDFVADWLRDVAPSRASAKTLERWRELADHHIKPKIGGIKLRDLAAEDIEAFYRDRQECGRCDGKGGLSARTVHHLHRLLVTILDGAVLKRRLFRNPAREAENKPKPARVKARLLDREQTEKLIETTRGTRMYAPVVLALTTGMRRGEVLGLRWQDTDLDGTRLTVHQTVEQTKAGISFKKPKSKASRRSIALAPATVDVLRRHRIGQMEERLALGLGGQSELVFTRYYGQPLDARNFTKEFSRIAKRAKIKANFHSLRHTHATALLRSGINIKVVWERLGHSTIAITLDYYSHVLPDMQAQAAQQVEAAFGNILGT